MCDFCNRAVKAMRYFFFPASKQIDDRTELIDQNIRHIKQQKEQVAEMTKNVDQPDVLRSLVLSMSASDRKSAHG